MSDLEPRLQEMVERFPRLTPCCPDIAQVFGVFKKAYKDDQTAYFCGNGGSASDADHWTGELLKGFESKRPIPENKRGHLKSELAQKLQCGFRAIPLTGFTSLFTAFGNDVHPDLSYAQLVWVLGRSGDLLVGLSTSGNARNVGWAFEAARAKGMKTILLTGQTGGKLKDHADFCVRVPSSRTLEIQELHLPIIHTLSLWLEDEFYEKA